MKHRKAESFVEQQRSSAVCADSVDSSIIAHPTSINMSVSAMRRRQSPSIMNGKFFPKDFFNVRNGGHHSVALSLHDKNEQGNSGVVPKLDFSNEIISGGHSFDHGFNKPETGVAALALFNSFTSQESSTIDAHRA
jgi:hypothetical protein